MDPRWRTETLPLDLPDDDPRWRGWLSQAQHSFLDPEISDDQLRLFREQASSEGHRLIGVYDDSARIPDTPVATYASVDKPLNVGGGRTVLADLISDVSVRATHRRQGVLRELITADLVAAKQRGCVMAALTASEGGIYGRFGFGVSTRAAEIEVDPRRFRLRRPIPGAVQMLRPADLRADYDRLYDQLLQRSRGAFGAWRFLTIMATGEFSWTSKGRNNRLMGLLHVTPDGVVDGLAVYEPVPDSDPATVKVEQILGSAEAQQALWEFLTTIDLVERLTYTRAAVDDPLQAALVNPRAIRYTRVYDMLWTRILDTRTALLQRGWDRDGELVLRIIDPLGFADGTYAISVRGDSVGVEPSEDHPDATVDAETLAQLYFAGIAPTSLAAAGRIGGDAAAVARLFTLDTPPYTPFGF